MPETEASQDNLAALRTHMRNVEQLVRFTIVSNLNNKVAVEAVFADRQGAAALYLALKGDPKTQEELVGMLGWNQSTVSRVAKRLLEEGLIESIPPSKARPKTSYMWSSVESMVGVSRLAQAQLDRVSKASKKEALAKERDTLAKKAPAKVPSARRRASAASSSVLDAEADNTHRESVEA
jgi:predicted transcriptional regulator